MPGNRLPLEYRSFYVDPARFKRAFLCPAQLMAAAMPKVQASELLKEWAKRNRQNIDDLIEEFAYWKAMHNPLNSWAFGKDGFYARPTRNGKLVLRHVHLPPKEGTPQAKAWDIDFDRTNEKTSDSVLIYAEDRMYGFLLLYIVLEPEGHDFAEMRTQFDRQLMKLLADAAEAFIFNGTLMSISLPPRNSS